MSEYRGLRLQLKIHLLIFLVAISNALVLGATAQHDTDPLHTSHECSVCISVQLNDDAPPPAEFAENIGQYFIVEANKPPAKLRVQSTAHVRLQPARGPPLK